MTSSDAERVVAFPLSFAQRALWVVYERQPHSTLYYMPFVVRLQGRLDEAALRRSFDEVIRRHEVLRTTFIRLGDEVQQVVHPRIELPFTTIDSVGEGQDHDDNAAVKLAEVLRLRPFDLRKDPPIRCTLIREAPDRHLLLLTMHHIACDGSSLPTLLQELSACYAAFQDGRAPTLTEVPIQYGDYAVWQRQRAEEQVFADSLAYWEQQLQGVPRLTLPTDHRPKQLGIRGAVLRTVLPHELIAAAEELGRQETATLFMTLLAAFKALLQRYCGTSDVVVGSPTSSRNHSDLEHVIGFFMNPVTLRTDVSGEPTFRQLVRRVRQVCLDAFSHQDAPFELVVERCDPRHAVGQHPLFQIMFMVHWLPSDLLSFPGLTVTPLHVEERTTSHFEMIWNISQSGGSYGLEIEYNTELFDEATAAQMARHFQALLSGVLADADRRLSDVRLSDEHETYQLLKAWNETSTAFPADACVHELFEAQVERAPDAVAIVDGDRLVTYGELDRRSNQLARYLVAQGIGLDSQVVLFLGKSAETFVGMLAVLKAGAAYVPLDVDAPTDRHAWLLSDVSAPIILTTTHLVSRLPPQTAQVLCLDRADHWRKVAEHPETRMATAVGSNQLAYVLHTSGSTGTPKGVGVSHRAIARLVKETNYVRLSPADSVAQSSSLYFDGSTFEIWGALLNGGRLVLIPSAQLLSPDDFARQIQAHRISVVFLTTALFNQIAHHVPWAFSGLRNVLFGGELVTPSRVRSVLEAGRPERLLHVYGPTETTSFASWHLVESVPESATNVPIGRGISCTQLYVLDQRLEPVPVGVAGELYIGGDGLARGYHDEAALTAERFVPDPFGGDGRRLYKSGDVCRWRAGGSVEFLCRVDHQVKIRGIRIEPGEVESVLTDHPDVSTALVTASAGEPEDKQLIAYVVPRDGARPDIAELRSFVARKLHPAMIPAAFVLLERFPVTRSGKVDRDRLPAPETSRLRGDDAYVTPQTRTEERLAGILSQLLKVEGIGRHENFLELGGNSLLAAKLTYRVEEVFQVAISVVAVFDHPTIAELAACIERAKDEGELVHGSL
jgi:amino acid adenylation domain-containing protein